MSDVVTAEHLPHLDTFFRAAEHSSFTAAARALKLTQAAVSQRIQKLEQVLGVSLFRRQGGRVLLTDAGHRLYGYAQRIFVLEREALRDITGKKTPTTGELVLAASSIPGAHLLPALLTGFRKKCPHVQVRASVADSQAVLKQVESGQAHLGLVGMRSDHPHLEFRAFAGDQLVVVVPARHAWRRRQRVTFAELARQPIVLREAGSGSRWCLEQALARAGKSIRQLRSALELGSNEAIKEAVLRGMGVAVLSVQAVKKELKTKALHALRIADLPLQRDMFVVHDTRRVLPIPAQLFLDHLELVRPY